MPVPVDQRNGPFFRQWRFESRLHGGGKGPTLVAFDDTGTLRWELPLEGAHPQEGDLGVGMTMDPPVALHVHGPFLEVAMHRRFAVLDGFDGSGLPKSYGAARL